MRLLNTQEGGKIALTEFFGDAIPPYAILSHTWGPANSEVTFKDFLDNTGEEKTGYSKIQFCSQQADLDGLKYFWVDTCCIDKSSSAELAEAINSMFSWYQKSEKCYVYLADVGTSAETEDLVTKPSWLEPFRASRWFTRGWTLQELIAPTSVGFYSREGLYLGDKKSLEDEIHAITKIDKRALRGHLLSEFSVRERMAWAAGRSTTREEDKTYCLLGIFDVFMPLIYGEGKKASLRLNEEINKSLKGDSILRPEKSIDLAQWLKSHDPQINHIIAQKKKQKNTGLWFLQGELYREWKSTANSLLWISGIPGSGKTVLCSTIIESLLEAHASNQSITFAYYYFDFGEGSNRSLDSLLRSLIVQLAANLTELPKALSDLHTYTQYKKQEPSTESLKQALKVILQYSTTTILAIDALDESTESDVVVEFIGELRSWKACDLSILLVSRPHFDGVDELKEFEPAMVSIYDDLANNDILMFVEQSLQKDPVLKHWPPKIKKDIKNILMKKSLGMFRWVACQIDVLRRCRTLIDVETILSTLPQTLEGAYDRILDNVSPACRSDVRAILQWLAFSTRPMRLEELAEIVAFDDTKTDFNARRRLLNPSEVLTMCSSLLVVNETFIYGSYAERGKFPITEIRLAHFTVKDYLLSLTSRESVYEFYKIDTKAAHFMITKACLTYLNMDVFAVGYRGPQMQDQLLRNWPLLDYAARFCGVHLNFIEKELDAAIRELLQKLFASHSKSGGGNFGILVGSKWHLATRDLIQITKPLYFASSQGLVSIVRLLLSDVTAVDLDAPGGRWGSTALEVAAYSGHLECVKLLLEAGANPNSSNDLGENALLWAQKLGFREIVDVLKEYGATEQ